MILFIDAVTVGKRLLVVEAMTSDDWKTKFSGSFLLAARPEGWQVPDGLPIDHRQAVAAGVRANVITTLLADMAKTATTIVVHGLDRFMAAIIHERELDGRSAAWIRPGIERRCTARSAAVFTKLVDPKATGDDQFLLPTLGQARKAFDIERSGVDAVAELHDALVARNLLDRA